MKKTEIEKIPHTLAPISQDVDGLYTAKGEFIASFRNGQGDVFMNATPEMRELIVCAVNSFQENQETINLQALQLQSFLKLNSDLMRVREALLFALKGIVSRKDGTERLIGSENAVDREVLKRVIAQAEEVV